MEYLEEGKREVKGGATYDLYCRVVILHNSTQALPAFFGANL